MVIIPQRIGVLALAFPAPGPPAGAMRVSQRHHVIHIHLRRPGETFAGIRPRPPTRLHPAPLLRGELRRHGGLGNQNLVAGMLAIAVSIDPMAPMLALIIRQPRRHRRHRHLQHQPGPRRRPILRWAGWALRRNRNGRRGGGRIRRPGRTRRAAPRQAQRQQARRQQRPSRSPSPAKPLPEPRSAPPACVHYYPWAYPLPRPAAPPAIIRIAAMRLMQRIIPGSKLM